MKRAIIVGLLVLLSALAALPVSSSLVAAQGATTQCQPDFTITASPTSATLPRANNVHFQVTATSVCGASGLIEFQPVSFSPPKNGLSYNYLCYCNPPTFYLDPTTPTGVTLAISAAKGTPEQTYTVTIPAVYTSCSTCPPITAHTVAVTVTVTDPVPPYP